MAQTKYTVKIVSLFILLIVAHVSLQSQEPRVMDGAELRLALKKLTVLGSVLYVAAHPDDENTAFLALMSKGRLVRAADLSLTRGDGGQNLIGPEQGELLGMIRTQELLAARRIDGAEQYFTRAIDFGYSKTSEETIRIWGREQILSDVVWVIRSFRPDVIVTRYTPTQGGHGNHTASAILAQEAFDAAGDPKRFPDQLKAVKPWKAKRILWNVFRFQQSSMPARPSNAIAIDLGSYSPILGKSFTEIAGQSRSMHKSQGFGAGQNRGEFINYFEHMSGEPATTDLFDGIDLTWSRVNGSARVRKLLEDAERSFDGERPGNSIPILMKAYGEISKLGNDPWVDVKRSELLEVIKSCAGLWIDALASQSSAVPGDSVKLVSTVLSRTDYPIVLYKISIPELKKDSVLARSLTNNVPIQTLLTVKLPAATSITQPYWLREEPGLGSYSVAQQQLIGLPQAPPPLRVNVSLSTPDGRIEIEAPVRYRWVDPVEGESYRPFEVTPPIAVNLTEKVFIFTGMKEKSVAVSIRSSASAGSGRLRLLVPPGWSVQPDGLDFTFLKKDDEQIFVFKVKPSSSATSGKFRVEAQIGSSRVSSGLLTIQYPHISTQTLFPPAEGKLVRIDLRGSPQSIGYIMGPGDEVPTALRQVGYRVSLLSDLDLANKDLSAYDVIIAGVRAYNTRPELKVHQKRLMEYVHQGGTYIVQYVTQGRGESDNLGPYPFNVSRDRVSEEDAAVTFVNPRHPILNSPNKITPADFDSWVQERGLYFADTWDPKYETLLSSHDQGESPKPGGLLVTKYGKGHFLYSAYAWFRQLPAGVPGAYRLFVNMISLGKNYVGGDR